jgi:hypothetical protein
VQENVNSKVNPDGTNNARMRALIIVIPSRPQISSSQSVTALEASGEAETCDMNHVHFELY